MGTSRIGIGVFSSIPLETHDGPPAREWRLLRLELELRARPPSRDALRNNEITKAETSLPLNHGHGPQLDHFVRDARVVARVHDTGHVLVGLRGFLHD